MALNKQVFLYSIDTSAFYDEKENEIHHDLLKLYNLRKEIKNEKIIKETNSLGIKNDWDFWKKTINKLIDEDKKKLVDLLEERLNNNEPRILNEDHIKDKNIVALSDSHRVGNLCRSGISTKMVLIESAIYELQGRSILMSMKL